MTALPVIGRVELLCEDWLHIRLNTLLPHCRFQTSGWLTDTIRRLLDEYEAQGKALPRYERALMVIDEHSAISGRHVFDQDNKGWKAVNNAVKGRLIPDDDQYRCWSISAWMSSAISAIWRAYPMCSTACADLICPARSWCRA